MEEQARSVVKLIGVRITPVGSVIPEEAALRDFSLAVEGAPPNTYQFLYGNRAAYDALADLISEAEQNNNLVTTANITIETRPIKRTGSVSLLDLSSGLNGLLNLSRATADLVTTVADAYRTELSEADFKQLKLSKSDWKKPFKFMPPLSNLLPKLTELFNVDVLVYPAYLTDNAERTPHFIAMLSDSPEQFISATPNPLEKSNHTKTIQI